MNWLSPLGTGIQNLGLAVIIGGILCLGAFTAPVLFKQFARPDAGAAMTIIFRRYDVVLMVGAGLILLGEALRLIHTGIPPLSFLTIGRFVVIVALAGMTFYSGLSLTPTIAKLYDSPDFRTKVELHQDFNSIHKLSEKLAKMELLAGVILLLLTPFANTTKLP